MFQHTPLNRLGRMGIRWRLFSLKITNWPNTALHLTGILPEDLRGDVKHLSNHIPEYRMRVGDWRALFEVADDRVVVYRILHRREAYR